jgi:galactonate dehydratase
MSAIAGIDQALWDIKGKALGVPVYELLGGLVRDRMKTYSWVGGDRPCTMSSPGIQARRELGFDTFKMNGTEELGKIASAQRIDAAVKRVAEIREAFGNTIEFGIDFHGRVALPMARPLLRELEQFRPLFVEEPVLPEQFEHYARLADSTFIPLAAGERMYSRFEFKHVFEQGGLSIVQPDLSHAGGITECVKIAANGRSLRRRPIAPALPARPGGAGRLPAARFRRPQRRHSRNRAWASTTTRARSCSTTWSTRRTSRIVDGYIKPLPKPGLGVEIDEARVIEASRNAPDWRNPVWRHAGRQRGGMVSMAACQAAPARHRLGHQQPPRLPGRRGRRLPANHMRRRPGASWRPGRAFGRLAGRCLAA